jgi:hypothetical protein
LGYTVRSCLQKEKKEEEEEKGERRSLQIHQILKRDP